MSYITPKYPTQAVLNALSEISEEMTKNGEKRIPPERQTEIILAHIRDFAGGKYLLYQLKRLTRFELMDIFFELSPGERSELKDKIDDAMSKAA